MQSIAILLIIKGGSQHHVDANMKIYIEMKQQLEE